MTILLINNVHCKKCTTCGKVKPIKYFHSDASRKDGFELRCKQCRRESYKKRMERKGK